MNNILALWVDYPEFGKLFLAEIYNTCRYVIPSIPAPLSEGAGRAEYEERGYKYEDGTVEKQDLFVTRMSGVARLLACVSVSLLPIGQQNKDHPFGLGNIWRWLTSTMNLPPVNDITATLIYDVLEVAAAPLFEKYRKHFLEVIRLLNEEYIPKIREATVEGRGGPIDRLQVLIKKIITNPSALKLPPAAKLKSGMNFL